MVECDNRRAKQHFTFRETYQVRGTRVAKHKFYGGGRSKIRVVVIEADLVEGELGEVTQAITNALRPPQNLSYRQVYSDSNEVQAIGISPGDELHDETSSEGVEVQAPRKTPMGSRPRKYASPKVVDDIDLESSLSFADYAQAKHPKNMQDRYLIAIAWFKLHRKVDAVSVHHVYTCFLHPKIKWPTKQADFDQPLRQLVKANRLGRGDRGFYVINHIGLAHVEELGASKE